MSTAVVRHDNDSEPTAIWLKQKGETQQAFAAFVVYREQTPPRSITRVAKAIGKAPRTLHEFSRKYDWVARAEAYTDHLDRLMLAAHEDDIVRRRREENEYLFSLGKAVQDAAASRIVGLTDEEGKVLVVPIDPNTLDNDDVVRWAEFGNKAVRLAIGLPTDVTGSIQISLHDFERVLGMVLELAARRMTRAEHEAFIRDYSAMVREQLGG